jgi:hypothetical protein
MVVSHSEQGTQRSQRYFQVRGLAPIGMGYRNYDTFKKTEGEETMIIDVHRHMVAEKTVQGDYIRGAQRSFAMMYQSGNQRSRIHGKGCQAAD